MTSTATRFPPTSHFGHARTQSFSYGSAYAPPPSATPFPASSSAYAEDAKPYVPPSYAAANNGTTTTSSRSQSPTIDASSAIAMLEEILKEEDYLRKEVVRLAGRPPERLLKLREAHKDWIIWRVRKELDKIRLNSGSNGNSTADKESARIRAEAAEKERLAKLEEDARMRREAEVARRAAEEEKRTAEANDRERERTLREERERAARERTYSATPGPGVGSGMGTGSSSSSSSAHSSGPGPYASWQRRFASGGSHHSHSHSTSSATPNGHGHNGAAGGNGYATDREGARSTSGSGTGPQARTRTQSFKSAFPGFGGVPPPTMRSQTAQGWREPSEAQPIRLAFAAYTEKWRALSALSNGGDDDEDVKPLRYADIPWPVLSPNAVNSPLGHGNGSGSGPGLQELTTRNVGAFLLSPFHSVDKGTKERLRAALMTWHPDKFEARWLPFVVPGDEVERKRVVDGVGAVTRAINELLAAHR